MQLNSANALVGTRLSSSISDDQNKSDVAPPAYKFRESLFQNLHEVNLERRSTLYDRSMIGVLGTLEDRPLRHLEDCLI